MNLPQQIEHAFGNRAKPTELIEEQDSVTPEQKDSLWFSGRDWRDITANDWEEHRDAIYAFTPKAFAYYLPSILVVSSQRPDQWFAPADSLLQMLDRSPVVEYWDSFITTRLIGLQAEEYEALKEWLLSLSGHKGHDAEDALSRALETVDLLQKETERVRVLLGAERRS
jgi:hypothetical protein